MKNATMRICNKTMLTFEVEYTMQLSEFMVAYLVGIGFHYINVETELDNLNVHPTKTEVMNGAKAAVKDYGDDYHYRTDEFPTDWEKLPQIIELTSHIAKLFSF